MTKKFSGAIVVFLILGVLFSNKVLFAKSTKAVGKQLSPKELKLAEAEQELKDTKIQYNENRIKIQGLLANGKIEPKTAAIESLNGFANELGSLSKYIDAYEEYMDEFKDKLKEAQSFSEEEKKEFDREIQGMLNRQKKLKNDLLQNIIPERIILKGYNKYTGQKIKRCYQGTGKISYNFKLNMNRRYDEMLATKKKAKENLIDYNEYLEDIGKTLEATSDLCKSYKGMIRDYAINVKDIMKLIKIGELSQQINFKEFDHALGILPEIESDLDSLWDMVQKEISPENLFSSDIDNENENSANKDDNSIEEELQILKELRGDEQ